MELKYGINGKPIKYLLFPLDRNMIHMRIENIFDHFDASDPTQVLNHTVYIQLPAFAETLYKISNGDDAKLANINIVETTLTGNQPYYEMMKNKAAWRGQDDGSIREPPHPKDGPNWSVAL